MSTHYTAPDADLLSSENSGEYGDINFFSINGRIGRVRYLAHLMVYNLAMVAAMVLFFILGNPGILLGIILYLVGIVLSIFAGAQRLHDLDKSAWFLLLGLVPIANIILGVLMLFASGSQGSNRFGAPPPPNSTWHIVLACLLPLIFIGGIVAAMAIPMLAALAQ